MGVRPEHIRFTEDGYTAIVEGTEYFGADTITALPDWRAAGAGPYAGKRTVCDG